MQQQQAAALERSPLLTHHGRCSSDSRSSSKLFQRTIPGGGCIHATPAFFHSAEDRTIASLSASSPLDKDTVLVVTSASARHSQRSEEPLYLHESSAPIASLQPH